MPKFSIIVPVHDAEDRMRMCLDSIKQQVFTDYELLIICDACTDNSEQIAKEYTDKVFSVDFRNSGKARNVGLDNATGDYVLFLDDDDWWLHEFVLTQISKKLSTEDVLFFSFIWKGVGYAGPLDNGNDHFVAPWCKCWKRSFIGDTRFSDRMPADDADFHCYMMRKLPKIVDWEMPMYYYNYMRPGSLTHTTYGRWN